MVCPEDILAMKLGFTLPKSGPFSEFEARRSASRVRSTKERVPAVFKVPGRILWQTNACSRSAARVPREAIAFPAQAGDVLEATERTGVARRGPAWRNIVLIRCCRQTRGRVDRFPGGRYESIHLCRGMTFDVVVSRRHPVPSVAAETGAPRQALLLAAGPSVREWSWRGCGRG
jgi:hypothetical protein